MGAETAVFRVAASRTVSIGEVASFAGDPLRRHEACTRFPVPSTKEMLTTSEILAASFMSFRSELEHFSCYCIAYPQWANQAEALLAVTWAKASVIAASRLSTVRALAERSCCLIFDHACSMGLKSGE